MSWQPQSSNAVKKVNPDDFVDASLKNAAEYKFLIAQKIAANETINYKSFMEFYIMLVNDAESACRGCRFIKKYKEKFDEEKLDEFETEFLEAARKYFRSNIKEGEPNSLYAGAEKKARAMLREAIEGPYDARLNEKKLELFPSGNTFSDDEKLSKNFNLANYKYQLLLESITAQKAARVSMNA